MHKKQRSCTFTVVLNPPYIFLLAYEETCASLVGKGLRAEWAISLPCMKDIENSCLPPCKAPKSSGYFSVERVKPSMNSYGETVILSLGA